MAVFKDMNPAAVPNALYKAIGGKGKPGIFVSSDGFGDSTMVKWKEDPILNALPKDEGVHFRFVLKNAELFSIKL